MDLPVMKSPTFRPHIHRYNYPAMEMILDPVTPKTVQLDFSKDPPIGHETEYDESSAKIWTVYVNATQKYDKALVESWKGDMDGILIFAGLFSACVTAFLVESSKLLQENQSSTASAILTQISLQLSGISNASETSVAPFDPNVDSPVPNYALRVNVLWFLSLLLSLLCALCATLIQGWSRNYLQAIERHATPHQRARIRAFLFHGIEGSHAKAFVDSVPTLLHMSLFLFIAGIQQYLYLFSEPVSLMVLIILGIYLGGYIVTTVLPVIRLSSPYQTPLSALFWHIKQFVWPLRYRDFGMQTIIVKNGSNLATGRSEFAINSALQSKYHDLKALSWTLTSLNEDMALQTFIDGIPGYLRSSQVSEPDMVMLELMKQQNLGSYISHLLETCQHIYALPADLNKQRQLICFHALSTLLVRINPQVPDKKWTSCFSVSVAPVIANMVQNNLKDSTMLIHASNTQALMFWAILNEYEEFAKQARAKLDSMHFQVTQMGKLPLVSSSNQHGTSNHWRQRARDHVRYNFSYHMRTQESKDSIISEIKNTLQGLKQDDFSIWETAVFNTLKQLCENSGIFGDKTSAQSYVNLKDQYNIVQPIYEGSSNDAVMMQEMDTSNVPVLKSVVEYFHIHCQALSHVLSIDINQNFEDQSIIGKLQDCLDNWCSRTNPNDIWKMITSAHLANFIHLICITANNLTSMTDTEIAWVIEVSNAIKVSPEEHRITDKMAKYLVVLLRFLKKRHTQLKREHIFEISPYAKLDPIQSLFLRLSDIAVSFVIHITSNKMSLLQFRFIINEWWYEHPDIGKVATVSLDAITEKLRSQRMKSQPSIMINPARVPLPKSPPQAPRGRRSYRRIPTHSLERKGLAISSANSPIRRITPATPQHSDSGSSVFIPPGSPSEHGSILAQEQNQSMGTQEQSLVPWRPQTQSAISLNPDPGLIELAAAAECSDSLGDLSVRNLIMGYADEPGNDDAQFPSPIWPLDNIQPARPWSPTGSDTPAIPVTFWGSDLDRTFTASPQDIGAFGDELPSTPAITVHESAPSIFPQSQNPSPQRRNGSQVYDLQTMVSHGQSSQSIETTPSTATALEHSLLFSDNNTSDRPSTATSQAASTSRLMRVYPPGYDSTDSESDSVSGEIYVDRGTL